MAAHGNPRWGETPSSRAFNAPALHPPERPWSRRRLQTFILLCFVAQLLFILAFGERTVCRLHQCVKAIRGTPCGNSYTDA